MIGVFDSGIGGLSVLRVLALRAPRADIVYFGDTKNAPYGPKNREELIAHTGNAINRLLALGATEIVSACNSVSVSLVLPSYDALGIEPVYIAPRTAAGRNGRAEQAPAIAQSSLLKRRQNVKIIEMVGPTSAYIARKAYKDVLLVATEATVRSHMYQETLRLFGIHPTVLPIPELAGLIERGASNDECLASIERALDHLSRTDFDSLVLGCTHYPFVRELFEGALFERGMRAKIIDPADPVAERAAAQFDTHGSGRIRFCLTKDSSPFRAKVAGILPSRNYSIEIV